MRGGLRAAERFPVRRAPAAGWTAKSKALIGKVDWSLSFIGLLGYVFAIITFRLPIGETSMIVALVGLAWEGKAIRVPVPLIAFGGFLAWAAIGYFPSRYGATVGAELITMLKVWLISLVVVNTLRTPARLRIFLIFFLVCFATHPARGTIMNSLHGITEAGRAAWNGGYSNPNDMAAFTFFPLGIAIALIADGNRWIRYGAIASAFILPVVVLLTQSRGAIIALGLFALLIALGQPRRGRAVLVLLTVTSLAVAAAPESAWERMEALIHSGADADSSSRQRYLILQIALGIVHDNPVFGVGLGAYPFAHAVAALNSPDPEFAGGQRDTHNTYVNVAAETGVPGLILFGVTVASSLALTERARRRAKRRNPRAAAMLWNLEMALVAFLTSGIFGSYAKLSYLYIHIAILCVIATQAETLLRGSGVVAPRGGARRLQGARPQLAVPPPRGKFPSSRSGARGAPPLRGPSFLPPDVGES